MTTRLFNSSSINDFRASASKRIFASAILFSAFFAGAEHVCQAFTLGYSAGGKAYMIVRANNIKMGEDAAAAVAKALNGKGIVLSLMGDQATAPLIEP